MNSFASRTRTNAFTLVELLTVIAIIGILAALLLPVLNQGQRRAQHAWCENNLREIGLAFHTFANDHSGKFPMAVSTNEGGSMEYVQSGFSASQIFYTSFRSFQALSAELVKPQVLTCPSDTIRSTATNFPALQNQNLSYFFDANGLFDKPTSILAGDRNLSSGGYPNLTIIKISPAYPDRYLPTWTWEMHQFQGNISFADGHVEEWNQSGFKTGAYQLPSDENLFMPSVVTVANSSPAGSGSGPDNGGSPGYGGNSGSGANSGNGANPSPAAQPAAYQASSAPSSMPQSAPMSSGPPNQMAPASGGTYESTPGGISTASGSEVSSETVTATTTVSNATVAMVVPGAADSMMSPFDQHLTKVLQHTFEWFYLLLLLLLLLYLMYKLRKWMRERETRQRAKQSQ